MSNADVQIPNERLYELVANIADGVVRDPRWSNQVDDLALAVLGMLLYGFALGQGRIIMAMEIDDIDAVVARVMVERVGVSDAWAQSLVQDASLSAFDKAYHPGQIELIGVGHQYMLPNSTEDVVENVFANFQSVRRAKQPVPEVKQGWIARASRMFRKSK